MVDFILVLKAGGSKELSEGRNSSAMDGSLADFDPSDRDNIAAEGLQRFLSLYHLLRQRSLLTCVNLIKNKLSSCLLRLIVIKHDEALATVLTTVEVKDSLLLKIDGFFIIIILRGTKL